MQKLYDYIRENKIETVSILLIFILGLVLRIITLNNFGDFWLDELYTTYYSNMDSAIKGVVELFKQDFHMPLYFLMLHFWIKIFGNSEAAIRSLMVILTTPLIIFIFYFAKDLFNKQTAYFSAILFAINTYAIYYSVENRLYGFAMVLAFLFTMLFIKVINTDLDKKYLKSFYVVSFMLFWTHNIAFIYGFFCFLAGLNYILHNKPLEFKRYMKISGVVALLALPSAIFDVINYFIIQNNITNYAKEFFNFSWLSIYDILENFFANHNTQIMSGTFQSYTNMFDNILDPIYFFFVFVPVLIALTGILRAIKSKNKNAALLFVPAFLYLAFCLFCGANKFLAYQTRYVLILLPSFLVLIAFGLTSFRNKIIGYSLVSLLLYLNIFYLFISDATVLNKSYDEQSGIRRSVETIDLGKNDLFIAPLAGHLFKYYLPKNAKMIDFSLDSALLMKNSSAFEFYFGKNYAKKYPKTRIKDLLIDDLMSNKPLQNYEDKLVNDYINKMNKGDKLILLSTYTQVYGDLDTDSFIDYSNYKDSSIFNFVMTKAMKDTKLILDKHLTLINKIKGHNQEQSIYVYQK